MIQIDDPFWAQLVDPALTSLAQPIRNMAQSAIDLLLQRIRKERDASKHIVFQFEVRERASVRSRPSVDPAFGSINRPSANDRSQVP